MNLRFLGGFGTKGIVLGTKRNLQYWKNIQQIFGSNLLAYYPLDEPTGTVAYDRSGNKRNGTYANLTLANLQGPSGGYIPRFTGTDGEKVDISAAGAVLPTSSGFMWGWARAFDVSVWTDSTVRQLLYFLVNASNYSLLQKMNTDNSMRGLRNAGGTGDGVTQIMYPTGLFHFGMSWSTPNDRVRVYRNGEQVGTDQSTLGTWAGTVATSLIGAGAVAGQVWNGWIGDVGLANVEPTAIQVRNLVRYALNSGIKRLSIIGDSTSVNIAANWAELVAEQWLGGSVGLINHAVAGHSIASNMESDALTAVSDDADVVIIALGTNDDNSGNMTTLQAKYEAGISSLKSSNPRAKIYGLNVLPRWTDDTGAMEVDKANIRTAIDAACTAQGVVCWDTYTSPWITADQTSDGLHPLAAGHSAIATQGLARL